MNKKLLILCVLLPFLGACSVTQHKDLIVNTVTQSLDLKDQAITSLLPSGDVSVSLGDKSVTVSQNQINKVKHLIDTKTKLQKGFVTLIGDQITDENIALVIHYASNLNISVEKLLTTIQHPTLP